MGVELDAVADWVSVGCGVGAVVGWLDGGLVVGLDGGGAEPWAFGVTRGGALAALPCQDRAT